MRRSSVTFALALVVLTACTKDGSPPAGTTQRPAPSPVPEARTEVGAGRLGEAIVVLGGLVGDGSATDRVDVYDLGTGKWSEGPVLPTAVHHPGVSGWGDRLIVAGGYTTAGAAGGWVETDDVWSLGEGERTWRAEPPLKTARGALGLAADGDRLVAFGGTLAGQVLDTVEVLVKGADAWRPAPPMSTRREHTAAASAGGRVYAIGGRIGDLESNLRSVESLDAGAFAPEWRKEPDLQATRGGTAAATTAEVVCVAGGEEPGGTIAPVECLRGTAWEVVGRLAEPRHGLGVVAGAHGDLHILAGGPRPGLFVSTTHEVLRIP